MYKLALLFAILATAQAQLVSDGPCDFSIPQGTKSIEVQANNPEITNVFEIQRISNTFNVGHCTNWTLVISGTEISVSMKEVLDRKLNEKNASVTVGANSKVYNVVFPDFNSNFTLIGGGDKFMVLYACSNQANQKKQEYAWVLGLNETLTEAEKKESQTFIDLYKLTNATWVQTSRTPDACKSGGTNNIIPPMIVLFVGFLVTKRLQ